MQIFYKQMKIVKSLLYLKMIKMKILEPITVYTITHNI